MAHPTQFSFFVYIRSWTERAIPHMNSLVSLKVLVGERPDWKNRKLSVSKPNEGSNIVSQLLRVVMTKLSLTIGIAIGKHFEKYLPYVMPMIQMASEICAEMDTANEAMMNYRNQLMSGIFDAYSGILQGLKNLKSDLMLPYAGHLLQVIKLVVGEKTREESVSKAAMGDLAHTLGPQWERAFYVDFLRECLDSDDYKMKEIATWTQRMINQGLIRNEGNCW
ncbi:hypothetical protein MKW92_013558 [Papaver armeniacum]|nr:hypothetical protein MKW92_013558 [Papaver armeniacum]